MNDIRVGDLVKILGKSYSSLEDKPILIVIEKIKHLNRLGKCSFIEFKLFCSETNRIFYWSLSERYIYEDLRKINNYELENA